MQEKFATEQEAIAKADELNEQHRRMDVFCPLIKEMCRTDCECFRKAFVEKHIVNADGCNYTVGGFYCDNRMFRSA